MGSAAEPQQKIKWQRAKVKTQSTSTAIGSELNKLRDKARRVAEVLSSSDSLESKEQAESIKSALAKFVMERA